MDQNVRSLISQKPIKPKFLDKYYPEKHEALLPFAVLEYAGINIKEIFLQIPKPKNISLSKPLYLKKIKKYFEDQIEKKLPKKIIEEKIRDKLRYDNDYAQPFIEKCMKELSNPYLYDVIVNQLAWDRFSQMKWIENDLKITLKEIRTDIAKLIIKHNHLYVLRHFEHLSKIPLKFSLNNDQDFLMNIQKIKIKPNMDIGDCELIHVAINGQPLGDSKKKRTVDSYTMDNPRDIKRRLISCMFSYKMLETAPFSSNYKFDPTYFGNIYIIDKKGQQKEKIDVADYEPYKVLMRKNTRDMDTLFL